MNSLYNRHNQHANQQFPTVRYHKSTDLTFTRRHNWAWPAKSLFRPQKKRIRPTRAWPFNSAKNQQSNEHKHKWMQAFLRVLTTQKKLSLMPRKQNPPETGQADDAPRRNSQASIWLQKKNNNSQPHLQFQCNHSPGKQFPIEYLKHTQLNHPLPTLATLFNIYQPFNWLNKPEYIQVLR